MRLIDADAFKWVLRKAWIKIADTYGKNDEYCQCIDKVMIWLNEQPTVEILPNIEGVDKTIEM